MRRILRFLGACACLLAAGCQSPAAPVTVVRVIALNDFHGHLASPGPFAANLGVPPTDRRASGGADYLAGHIARLRAGQAHSVVVGAGDFIGGSPLVSALFHDEPAVEVLNRIGLEFNGVGNHEFDRGTAELLRLQRGGCKAGDPNSCRGAEVGTPVPFEGARFAWLAANVIDGATGRPILAPYGIKRFGGVAVGFIGMTLRETPHVVVKEGVAGLEFRDEADTVNALVPELRAQGVEAIVVLLHQGGVQAGSLHDINGCDGGLEGSPVRPIVARFDDAVDLVITGHTHAAYNCRLPSAAGRAIPVTSASAFGRVVTSIDLAIDGRTRDVTSAHATNLLVDRTDAGVTPDAAIARIVAGYQRLVAPIANGVIGRIARDVPARAIDPACNMPAGELIADAQLAATAAPDRGGAQVAFMNRGGARAPGLVHAGSPAGEGAGNVTYAEAFTMQPFGNSLVTLTLSTQQLRDLLEQQFAGCRGQPATSTRILSPSAGFRYAWDGSKPCDARISDVTLQTSSGIEVLVDPQGRVVDPQRTVRVTVNSFIAGGGDGFTTLAAGRDPVGGGQDIDALVAYLARYRAPAAAYDPMAEERARPRKTRVNAPAGGGGCPLGGDTNL